MLNMGTTGYDSGQNVIYMFVRWDRGIMIFFSIIYGKSINLFWIVVPSNFGLEFDRIGIIYAQVHALTQRPKTTFDGHG